MKLNTIFLATVLMITSVAASGQEADMPGSKDYPDMPRVDGSHIVAYGQNEYDAGLFVSAREDKKPVIVRPEGKRTRIVYVGTEAQGSLQMIRNYQRAFASFGDYKEIYSCSSENCGYHMARDVIWNDENMVPTIEKKIQWLHQQSSHYKQPMYVYGTITKGDKHFHVSVFASVEVAGMGGVVNKPVVHIEVLEEEGFEPSLIFINAAAMTNEIVERGRVALYGIQFDFDSASLQPQSTETIAEIAKLMTGDPALKIYVVGHTDNEGAHGYNMKLSADRAASVVAALSTTHGIAMDRLTSTGVGQVAPVATNDSEAGRELNRRVEIVKR